MKNLFAVLFVVSFVFSNSCIASCAQDHEGQCDDTSSRSSGHEYILPALIVVGLGAWYIFSNNRESNLKEVASIKQSDHFRFTSLAQSENVGHGLALQLIHEF